MPQKTYLFLEKKKSWTCGQIWEQIFKGVTFFWHEIERKEFFFWNTWQCRKLKNVSKLAQLQKPHSMLCFFWSGRRKNPGLGLAFWVPSLHVSWQGLVKLTELLLECPACQLFHTHNEWNTWHSKKEFKAASFSENIWMTLGG